MILPIPPDYLEKALEDGCRVGKMTLIHRQVGRALDEQMTKDNSYFNTLIAEMDKTYRHTWSWLDMRFGEANLIAFSSGYGDGLYATYIGFDSNGDVLVVVTDFGIVPFETNGDL